MCMSILSDYVMLLCAVQSFAMLSVVFTALRCPCGQPSSLQPAVISSQTDSDNKAEVEALGVLLQLLLLNVLFWVVMISG